MTATKPRDKEAENARRRDRRAQAKEQARHTQNYDLMVATLVAIEPALTGEDLVRRAEFLAQRIDLTGWYVIQMDDGVWYTSPDKKSSFEHALYSYDLNPRRECYREDYYIFHTNRRSDAVRGLSLHVGTWEGLAPDGWDYCLHNWLRELIAAVDEEAAQSGEEAQADR